MKPKSVRVLLASPLPPPVGGIATWTRLVLATRCDEDIAQSHVNTSPQTLHHYTAGITPQRLVRQAAVTARVLWAILRGRADVFHLTSSYDRAWIRDTMFLEWARRLGAATIVNLRGGDFERFYKSRSAEGQRRILATLARCAAVVAITAETAAFLESVGLRNVRVIPNCVDVSSPEPAQRPRRLLRWLFVGWVLPAKGVLEILETLRAFPEARLTLVGPTVAESGDENVDALAAALRDPALVDRIQHIEYVDPENVRALYARHDMFVFPSRREGFPNVVLEAMEAGIPIVASSVGAIPEMIADGVEGLVVPPRDAGALRRAVASLIDDPERALAMAIAAQQRVQRLYSVDTVVAQWRNLYRELVAPTRAVLSNDARVSVPPPAT